MVSIELLLSLLIIIFTLYLLIKVNIFIKTEIEENINYEKINEDVCFIKKEIIKKNNGELIDDFCKKSTDNSS